MKTYRQFNESLRDKMTPKSEEDIITAVKSTLKENPERVITKLKYDYKILSKIVDDQEIHDSMTVWASNLARVMKGKAKSDAVSTLSDIMFYLYKKGYVYSNVDTIGSLWFKHKTYGGYDGGHFSVNGYTTLQDTKDYVERMENLRKK